MRRSMVLSAALHLAVIVVILVGLPHFTRELPEDTPIPVEIVTIADKTTARPQEQPPEPPRPKPPEPPQEAKPAPTPPTPTPAPPQPAPPQQAEAKPAPTPPEPVPQPKAEPLPDAKKKEPAKAPEPPTPQRFADAKPQKKPAPSRDDFVSNLLKDVAPKKQTSDTPSPTPVKNPSPPPPAPPKAQAIDDQLTMSEIDAIRRQYIDCWSPPAGARNARDLVVTIRIELNPDGSVRRADYADMSQMGDPFYRAAAESALRAVLNPRCNPLKNLPVKKYDVWKSVIIDFNPRDMLG